MCYVAGGLNHYLRSTIRSVSDPTPQGTYSPVPGAETEVSDGLQPIVGPPRHQPVCDRERQGTVEAMVLPEVRPDEPFQLVRRLRTLLFQGADDLTHLVEDLAVARALGAGLRGWHGHDVCSSCLVLGRTPSGV